MTTCPRCKGSGESGMVLVHTSKPLSDDEASKLQDEVSICSLCAGQGDVNSDKYAWVQIGELWREARLSIGLGLREWAEQVGVPASEYCNMEQGRVEPNPCCSPLGEVKKELSKSRQYVLEVQDRIRKWGYRSCRMPEFKTVKQPPGTSLCGAAVCAMAIGKTLDEVLAETDWRHLSYTSGLVRYLASYGISMGWYLMGDGTKYKPWSMGTHCFVLEASGRSRPAIVAVKSAVYEEADHWVFWDGEAIRDPSNEQDEYEVLEVHWLNYWPNPPPDAELPTDYHHAYKPISSVRSADTLGDDPTVHL
jgi:hypothetical protein